MLNFVNETDEWVTNIFRSGNIETISQYSVIVINECSMLSDNTLNDHRLQHIKLILVGDLNQLPPVSGDSLVFRLGIPILFNILY